MIAGPQIIRGKRFWLVTFATTKRNGATDGPARGCSAASARPSSSPSCWWSAAPASLSGIAWLIVPEWRVNHGFVEHTCKVVEKRVAEVQSEKGLLFRPEVKIEYEVQGVTYLAACLRHPSLDAKHA